MLKIENYPSPNFGERKEGAVPTFLVMHYTACPTDDALFTLTSKAKQVSAHYLVPPEGDKVYSLVNESQRAWHAGKSFWKEIEDVNSSSIGIENVNWGYTYGYIPPEPKCRPLRYLWSAAIHSQRRLGEYLSANKLLSPEKEWYPYPLEQIEVLTRLSKKVINEWKIKPEDVVGHSDVAPQRKIDPGPLFPWEKLAKKGVGVWYDLSIERVHSDRKQGDMSISWMQQSLKSWGYQVPLNGHLDPETQKVVQAFQMHFRPKDHNGLVDVETSEILDVLLCQRQNKMDCDQ